MGQHGASSWPSTRHILDCMADLRLAVRVSAALALQPLNRHDVIRISMQQSIPTIMHQRAETERGYHHVREDNDQDRGTYMRVREDSDDARDSVGFMPGAVNTSGIDEET